MRSRTTPPIGSSPRRGRPLRRFGSSKTRRCSPPSAASALLCDSNSDEQIQQRQSGSLQGGGTRASGQRSGEGAESYRRDGRGSRALDGETGKDGEEKEVGRPFQGRPDGGPERPAMQLPYYF